MEWIYFLLLLITHSLAWYMGTQTETDQAELYDIYLKWEHEKWLEERRERHDHD